MSFHSDLIMKLGGMQPDPFGQLWRRLLPRLSAEYQGLESSTNCGGKIIKGAEEFGRAMADPVAKDTHTWNFQTLHGDTAINEADVEQILATFRDGFALPGGWSLAGVHEALQRSTVLGLLRDAEGMVFGYAFYSIPQAMLDGTYLLWEDALCLRRAVQGCGYTRSLVRKVCDLFPDRAFGWVGGRTQNPVVMLRYAGMGGTLFPFLQAYDSAEGRALLGFLLEHLEEVRQPHEAGTLDAATGICRAVYPEGRLGNYPVDCDGAALFERQLADWGFDRERGDAVLIVTHLVEPLNFPSEVGGLHE